MPLNSNDKLKLLSDILHNQQSKATATEAECLQINRLIQSLTEQQAVDSNLDHTLQNIYTFAEQALNQPPIDNHVLQNKGSFQEWIEGIDGSIK